MIIEFSASNFLSFKDKITFNLLASSSKELEDNYAIVGGKKILKTSAIYGANASGKTNLLKVLKIVQKMLLKSYRINDYSTTLIEPFILDETSSKSPSEFEIKFIIDDIKYVYGFIADNNNIIEEYLYYYPNGREAVVFKRYNTNEYIFNQKEKRLLNDIAKKTASNRLFLATSSIWDYQKSKFIYNFLTKDITICFDLNELQEYSLKYLNDNPEIKPFALNFFKETDLNIEDYSVNEISVPTINFGVPLIQEKNPYDKKVYDVKLKYSGIKNTISLNQESIGTQMLFFLIPFIQKSFNSKKVLLIDEIDRSLHPLLVEYLVNMFNDKSINKFDSQLIFNTHDTNLLNLNILRRDQIWFTEKNDKTLNCELFSLTDFQVRKNENVEKGYLLGRYGAVPSTQVDINL